MDANKIVIIVNGKGGVGKDTLCGYFCKYYNGRIVSSIAPIKKLAKRLGWKGGKEPKDRKFLSDLKFIMDEYKNTSMSYLLDNLRSFAKEDRAILFVMIREPDNIETFKKYVEQSGIRATTLLIRRSTVSKKFGNVADDEAENYAYDYIFDNDGSIAQGHNDFVIMVKAITDEVGIDERDYLEWA